MALAHRASDTVAAPDREAAPDQAANTAFVKLSHHLWAASPRAAKAPLDSGPFCEPNRGAGCDFDCT